MEERINELIELYGFDKEEALILFGEIFDDNKDEVETSPNSDNNQKK